MALTKTEEIQQDIEIVERNIKALEKSYNDYFEGVTSREPKELRTQTEFLVKKWWGKPIANTMLRFKIQNLVQRFNSYKEKWERQLRLKARTDKETEYL